MPRTVYSNADRARYEDADEDKAIRARIGAWCEFYGRTVSDLAIQIGMNPRTLYRRKDDPGTLALREYRMLMRATEHAAKACGLS